MTATYFVFAYFQYRLHNPASQLALKIWILLVDLKSLMEVFWIRQQGTVMANSKLLEKNSAFSMFT